MPHKYLSRVTLAFMVLLLFVPPVAHAKQEKQIFLILTEIQENVSVKNWDAAEQYAEKLERHYKDKQWKYQLMGDKEEYETAANDIQQIKAAIAVKDHKQATILLTHLRTLLKQIYKM
ncbi:ABC-type sugar transport system substrate-binding protein [Pullulanibacillus pueri]|uniref:DUF4363 family protein n=1 Tax=Pullulanibacillus pueri TaxID=1437324 RepID=A0A8J3ELC3_9BACL|nr:DUF4363 family protein [Pullulanibacillus pueri]MBM7681422.1 ABC-type sugar transport system substrate-binding protein [Pullulanibacillus pueri]GGH78814.1 hypothetical protein GCM10007096_12810 [Pullulanibacillus pueri]